MLSLLTSVSSRGNRVLQIRVPKTPLSSVKAAFSQVWSARMTELSNFKTFSLSLRQKVLDWDEKGQMNTTSEGNSVF